MSFVVTIPDLVTAAGGDLASIHSTLSEATAAAAGPTTVVVAAAGDEVSAAIASVFGALGQDYQALYAQAAAFHGQFVNLLNGSAAAYLSAEAANVQQAMANAVNAAVAAPTDIGGTLGAVVGRYESVFANTAANLSGIGNTWTNVTEPALLQAFATQIGVPQRIAAAFGSGNLLSLLNVTGESGLGYANLAQQLTTPISVSVTSLSPSGASIAVGFGLPSLLAFDALGAQFNAASAAAASSAAFYSAVQAGDPLGATIALIDAPANIANGLLNGQQSLAVNLPLPGLSLTANIPFTGLLAPLQPWTASAMGPGLPLMNTVTVTGSPVGGLVPALLNYAPQLLATALTS
ncbi:PE family protein [Mycobacterium sp. 050134]|uniref:PE family protein n=1 Tax=Mycobacterium sp. 050134 TaxID=3096111 RepID=UPI002ED841D7